MTTPDTAAPHDTRLSRARTIARLLDTAVGVPGTRMRFGLDPVLGLIPGLGDLAGAAMSGYVVLTGVRMGVPRTVIARMIANVAMDTVAGSLPILGDLFDAGWKSNTRNVRLLEKHLAREERGVAKARTASTVITAIVLFLIFAAGVALTFFMVRALVHLIWPNLW
jgi:Domain of unknown function (DUF4112)